MTVSRRVRDVPDVSRASGSRGGEGGIAPGSLLTLCAQAHPPPDHIHDRASELATPDAWAIAIERAERHGMGPLLYARLRTAGVDLPRDARRRLHAVAARHRRANEVRFAVLAETLDVFDEMALPTVLLKGAALAPLVYAELGLRPMSDLDLLLPAEKAIDAQRVLRELGFDAPIPDGMTRDHHHHLPTASRWVGGVCVQIEIHRDALAPDRKASLKIDRPPPDGIPVSFGGRSARTLAAPEMLWHLCRHLLYPTHDVRLIGVADLAAFVDRFAPDLDWGLIARRYPAVPRALALLDDLVPLIPPQARVAHRIPRRLGARYLGWPLSPVRARDGSPDRLRLLRETVLPSEWWLRVTYGTGLGQAGLWAARGRHAEFVLGAALARARTMMTGTESAPGILSSRPGRASRRTRLPTHPEPHIYAVEIHNDQIGFFAHLEWCLEILLHCDRSNLIPYFKLSSPCYRSEGRGDNFLDYYFIQRHVTPRVLDRVASGEVQTRCISTIGHLNLPENYDDLLNFDIATPLVRRYLLVRPHVLAQVRTFTARHFDRRSVMGLHVRGTDKMEAERISYEEISGKVTAFLDTRPDIQTIFVSSDEQPFIDFFRDRFRAFQVVVRDDHHRSPAQRAHPDERPVPEGQPMFRDGGLDGYAVGEDALVNALLLSRCDVLLKTASIMSGWCKIFNPRLPVVMLTEPYVSLRWFPERDLCGAGSTG